MERRRDLAAAGRLARRLVIAPLAVLAVAIAAGAAGSQESFREDGTVFELEYRDRFVRSLSIRGPGSSGEAVPLTSYPLPECGLRSSETGVFTLLEEGRPTVYVVAICEQLSNARSLFVFAPAENAAEPIFSLTEKRELGVMLTAGGLIASWRDGQHLESAIWEARDNSFLSNRFADARDRLLFGQAAAPAPPTDSLPAEDYLLPLIPDEPLRLGPSAQAPFFDRLRADPVIHLAPPAREEQPFWRVGAWLRVCVPDGPCGYVRSEAVAAP